MVPFRGARLMEWPVEGSVQKSDLDVNGILSGVRVLLVDDCADNRVLFRHMLSHAGAEVREASDGAVAIQLQDESFYDLILMDMRMPVVDGYTATGTIRARGFVGPIIALTAHSLPGEEARCRAAGCSHFCQKPIGRRQLIEVVARAVNEAGCPVE